MIELVGRNEDLERLWDLLRERSVLLIGPRRVGKTVLLGQMAAEPREGWTAVRVDLQGESTVEGMVERTLGELGRRGLGPAVASSVTGRLRGVEVAGTGVSLHPPTERPALTRLEDAVTDATEGVDGRLLLAFDEVPWWLEAVARLEGPDKAREALAHFRRIRQRDDLAGSLRMVVTGSVGLAGLAHELGASRDINDLVPPVELRPLTDPYGRALAESEITLNGRKDTPDAVERIHRIAGGFPHWIKLLAGQATARVGPGEAVTVTEVDQAVESLLGPRGRDLFADEGSEHFVRRHGGAVARQYTAVLGAAAQTAGGCGIDELLAAALAAGAADRRVAQGLVLSLVDSWHLDPVGDHYLFVLPLFRLWWLRYGELQ